MTRKRAICAGIIIVVLGLFLFALIAPNFMRGVESHSPTRIDVRDHNQLMTQATIVCFVLGILTGTGATYFFTRRSR